MIDRIKLFEDNQRLAHFVMHKHFPRLAFDEDMIQEAIIGLWRACQSFDENKAQFSTYAVLCIRHSVLQALRKEKKSVKASASLGDPIGEEGTLTLQDVIEDTRPLIDEGSIDLKDYLEKQDETQKQIVQYRIYGRTQAEIAKKVGLSQAQISRVLRNMKSALVAQNG